MTGKTALIIGASSDTGLALIREIADRYEHIYAHCFRGRDRLEGCPGRITVLEADLSEEASAGKLADEILSAGVIPDDIIFLSSGPFEYVKFAKSDTERLRCGMEISLFSAVRILKALLPPMAKRGSGNVTFMLSSVTDGRPPKFLSDYTVEKYALLGLLKSLAVEYAEKGIRVNGVSPDMIDTRFVSGVPEKIRNIAAMNSERGRLLTTADVVPAIVSCMSVSGNAPDGGNIIVR